MANFRIRPGMWVDINETLKPVNGEGRILNRGESHQIVSIDRWTTEISFVGVKGFYKDKSIGKFISPAKKFLQEK